MTKKLRIRFVILSMLSLIVMQSLIIFFCTNRSYRNMANTADEIIATIVKAYPDASGVDGRYAVVLFDENDRIIDVDLSHIVTTKKQQAEKLASSALRSAKDSGFIKTFRYGVFRENGTSTVILLVRGGHIDALKNAFVSYVVFSASGLIVMLGLLIIASHWLTRPIEASYRKQKEFVTSASHEMKTPLTVINADADILLSDNPDNRWVLDICAQTKLLTNMTHSLVMLARLDEQNVSLSRIEFSISDVAEDVAKSYEALAKKEHKGYSINIVPNTAYSGHENMIRQLFSILLDNAFKYCAESGLIEFALKKEFAGVSITVTNTAEHINEEQLSRFFDRFYRADNASTSQKSGYGLGLSIADEIVKKHNGKILAKTDEKGKIIITVILR